PGPCGSWPGRWRSRPNKAAAFPAPRQAPRRQRSAVRQSPPEQASRAGQYPVHQLLHRRDEAVRIEGVTLEAECGMASEHQVLLDRAAVRDFLERLLDAEAARVGEAAGRILLIVGPGREAALAKASHAFGLVDADLLLFLRRHEDQRVVGRFHGIGEAARMPFAGVDEVAPGDPIILLGADPDVELEV